MLNTVGQAGKKHAFEPPIGKINQIPIRRGIVGQDVAKTALFQQIGGDLAKGAAKQAVCFVQFCRGATLGALMID
jgi:hypothetical protein